MRGQKYYSTMMMLRPKQEIIDRYEIPWHVRQFTVVIKAHSYAEAERKCVDIIGYNGYRKSHTSETGNKQDIECCDDYDAIVRLNRECMIPLKEFMEVSQ